MVRRVKGKKTEKWNLLFQFDPCTRVKHFLSIWSLHTWTIQLNSQHHTTFSLMTRFDGGINLIDVCKIQGPICWVFVLAALLLKQISLFVLLESMFQHVVRHLCKMLDTMFQHPGTVQCAWVHAYLYVRPSLFKETIFPYLLDQATRIS